MIDKNKIAKAVRKCLAAFRKANPDGYSSSIIDIESICLKNFKDGAKWAINESLKDLWHPSSEKPKKGRVFLYKTIFKGYGVNQIFDKNEWKYIIKYQKATQWLYIDDLLPKEGGE